MNHTSVLRTPLDAAKFTCRGVRRLPFASGAYRTTRKQSLIQSPVLSSPAPFNELVGSWNALLPPGAKLVMEARALVGRAWTPWYLLGSATGRPGRRLEFSSPDSQADKYGHVDKDTLILKSPAHAFQYRLKFTTPSRPATLLLAAATISDSRESPPQPPPWKPGPWVRNLQVTGRSQRTAPEAYQNDICSPTSVSAVLDYWGTRRAIVDMADRVRDRTTGDFGNWTFNMAAAGALGLEGFVARLESLDDLAAEVAAGRPVVVSVGFGPGELRGAPIKKTAGHLMVVTGFTAQGDVIVMDPAGRTARQTRRVYRRSEFHRAWRVNKRGLAYLLCPLVKGCRLTAGVPAADLRRGRGSPGRVSQLLYGEKATALAAAGGWIRVSADEQAHLDRDGVWRGYPGWARAAEFSGALAPAAPATAPALAGPARRRLILKTAESFLGLRYRWGGRSHIQGMDCSGLSNLAYRAAGLDLPRDAHDQHLRCRPVSRRGLKPADLVFLSAGPGSQRITHVMIYSGGEELIESRQTAGRVLRCTFADRFGIPLSGLESGQTVTDNTSARPRRRRIFFGSCF